MLVWGIGVAAGLALSVAVDVDGGPEGGLVVLAVLALGFLVGVVLGHVAWIVLIARLLRPFGHTARTVATAVLTPSSLVVVTIGINDLGIPWLAWPFVAVFVPAALASWASAPGRTDTGGLRRDVR